MTTDNPASPASGWLASSGVLHIFRTLGLAIHPAKIGLALATIILTFILGTLLDWGWSLRGGVDPLAIERFILAREFDQPYEPVSGPDGIFEVWREHSQRCIFGFMGSSVPGASVAAGTPVGAYLEAQSRFRPLRNLASFGYGVWWMFTQHTLFFILFAGGALVLWALGGGAICRLAAVQFARDERQTLMQGYQYARANLFGGFVMAPCIPLVFVVLVMLLLALFGMVLWIPLLGDLIGGLLFFLPVLGGMIIATLLVGLITGGSLMWPAVAVEGQDAYDAFSRSLSYAFSRPWKSVIYAVVAVIYASLCWVFVHLLTYFALSVTRSVVAFGTAPFGWWGRRDAGLTKIELLWPLSGPASLHAWPDWSRLTWYEHISAVIIGLYVMLVVALMFSFLVSFYYCACTVIYFLLRRDVDKTDLEDVHVEDYAGDFEAASPAPARPNATGVSLPVVNSAPPAPP